MFKPDTFGQSFFFSAIQAQKNSLVNYFEMAEGAIQNPYKFAHSNRYRFSHSTINGMLWAGRVANDTEVPTCCTASYLKHSVATSTVMRGINSRLAASAHIITL